MKLHASPSPQQEVWLANFLQVIPVSYDLWRQEDCTVKLCEGPLTALVRVSCCYDCLMSSSPLFRRLLDHAGPVPAGHLQISHLYLILQDFPHDLSLRTLPRPHHAPRHPLLVRTHRHCRGGGTNIFWTNQIFYGSTKYFFSSTKSCLKFLQSQLIIFFISRKYFFNVQRNTQKHLNSKF